MHTGSHTGSRKAAGPEWDVIVIGGGPAGMMAAGVAAEHGARVLLIEKNKTLGKKLLITGGGRCNVTNAETDVRKLLAKFNESDQFLFSAFSQYSVSETLDFFHSNNMPTKVENEKRVFPVSNKAQSVWDVLVNTLKKRKVTIISNTAVTGFTVAGETITAVQMGRNEITAKAFIVATGGKSRPETGSTGDGFAWLKNLGHTVIEPTAALVPIAVKNKWISKLAGVALPGAKITTFQHDQKQDSRTGKVLFTHVGLTGPTILNMSRDIGELLNYGDVRIEIDTLPALDYSQLNTRLQELFKEHHTKKIKNALPDIIPTALVPIIIDMAGVNADTPCNSVTREHRIALGKALKHMELEVKGLLGTDKAIVTSGGVKLTEVDFKTMKSRNFANLYIVGDMLNIDRPSGGYSLQLCWTTGFVAGKSAAGANEQIKK